MSCRTCRFWRPTNDKAEKGQCRRFPPSTTGFPVQGTHPITRQLSQGTQVTQHVPTTTADEWCGEFQSALKLAS